MSATRTTGRKRLAKPRCAAAAILPLILCACSPEVRPLGPTPPQTPPTGPNDPRARQYEANAAEVSLGGRYVRLYGCDACHGDGARGALDLADGVWRRGGAASDIYAAIDAAHPGRGYAERLTPETRWRITAFLRLQARVLPSKRRRSAVDLQGEPQGTGWAGPIP